MTNPTPEDFFEAANLLQEVAITNNDDKCYNPKDYSKEANLLAEEVYPWVKKCASPLAVIKICSLILEQSELVRGEFRSGRLFNSPQQQQTDAALLAEAVRVIEKAKRALSVGAYNGNRTDLEAFTYCRDFLAKIER